MYNEGEGGGMDEVRKTLGKLLSYISYTILYFIYAYGVNLVCTCISRHLHAAGPTLPPSNSGGALTFIPTTQTDTNSRHSLSYFNAADVISSRTSSSPQGD